VDNLKWEHHVNNSLAMHSASTPRKYIVQIQRGDLMLLIIIIDASYMVLNSMKPKRMSMLPERGLYL